MAWMRWAVEDGWDSDTNDFFEDLEKLALIFEDSDYTGMFWFLTVASLFFALVFAAIYWASRTYNLAFWFLEYFIYYFLYVPIISNLSLVVYCNSMLEVE
jgi:hypothetical protein